MVYYVLLQALGTMNNVYIIYEHADITKARIVRSFLEDTGLTVLDYPQLLDRDGVYLLILSHFTNTSDRILNIVKRLCELSCKLIPIKVDNDEYSVNLSNYLSLIDYVNLSDITNKESIDRLLDAVLSASQYSVDDTLFLKANKEFSNGNHFTGIQLLKSAAANGDSYAQTVLGTYYLFGDNGLPQDPNEAAYWYKQATKSEIREAERQLGLMYRTDNFIRHDYLESYFYLRKAADGGDIMAARELGNSFMAGLGVPRDPVQAEKWLTKAAELDDSEAQYILGNALLYGNFFAQNIVVAISWLQRAVENNHEEAKFLLGKCYREGIGVKKNLSRCYELWLEAATNGEPQSQCGSGHLLCEGKAVEKNFIQAAFWLRKAKESGYDGGNYLLEELERYGY